MRIDFTIDERAMLTRVLGHLEEASPIAPDLPVLPLVAGDRRRWPAPVVVAGAFLLAVALVGPAALILRDLGEGGLQSGDESAADPQELAVAPTVMEPSETNAAPSTASAPAVPEVIRIEPVAIPITGTEGFLLTANDLGLFASATVPNPDMWDERVWRSTDEGASWQEVLTVIDDGIVVDIAAKGEEIAAVVMSRHVVDGPSFLYRSLDGGETWDRIEVPEPDGIVGMALAGVAFGDTTVLVGTVWNDVLDESFDGGQVMTSTPMGVRSVAWVLDGDTFSDPVDISPEGWLSDVLWTGDMFVTAGVTAGRESLDSARPAIWTSVDGTDWVSNPIPDLPQGIQRGDMRSVVLSGNGAVIATGDAIPENADTENSTNSTLVYVRGDAGDWSMVHVTEYPFGYAVGTEWGFVAGAGIRGSDGTVVISSNDGTEWMTASDTDIRLGFGTSTSAGAFLSGSSADEDGVGIWLLTAE